MKRIALLALLLAPMTSFAIPVQWTLDGFLISNFQPGGTAEGSFVYDADTGVFSDIALTTTGSVTGGLSYTTVIDNAFYLSFYQAGASGDDPTIALQLNGIFLSSLTNAGGVLTVNPETNVAFFAEYLCGGVNDCSQGFGFAMTNWYAWNDTPSTLTGRAMTSVDEPGSLALFGAASLMALFVRRRRKA